MKQNHKTAFTRDEVIEIINQLLQYSDIVMDCITNEDPNLTPEELLAMVEEDSQYKI